MVMNSASWEEEGLMGQGGGGVSLARQVFDWYQKSSLWRDGLAMAETAIHNNAIHGKARQLT